MVQDFEMSFYFRLFDVVRIAETNVVLLRNIVQVWIFASHLVHSNLRSVVFLSYSSAYVRMQRIQVFFRLETLLLDDLQAILLCILSQLIALSLKLAFDYVTQPVEIGF